MLVGEYTVSFTNSHHPNITIMVTEAHTDLTPLNLGDSVPYVPPSGTTVTTVILPGGAAEGQIVGWVGGQLAWVSPTLGTDHGALAGLGDDDHTQYALADGTRGNFATTAHQHPALDISDATATGRAVLTAVDGPAARTAIGAGTSDLAIGTTATTAAAGNRAATTTAIGMVELATTAEATTGTDTTRAVTAAGVKAVGDTKVPTTRTVNAKALSADIILTPADIGAAPALGADDNYVTDLEKAALHTHANKTALDAVVGTNTGDQTWATLPDKPTTFPPEAHTQSASTITDLTEAVQDIVGGCIVAGTNVTVTYNDSANTFTINATASGGGETDPEIVRDVIGAALIAGSGIQITVNDAGDSITIASTAVLPTRQVTAGTGLTGGGDLTANRTLAVSYGTTAGTATEGNDSRVTGAAQKSANLSDLANAGTARTNLGLGTAATTAATDYATAAQGAKADTALQPATAQAINAQTGTTYTLVAADAGKVVTLSNTGAITLNAPGNVFTAGQRVDVVVTNTGMATVVGTSGATINGTPTLVSRARYSAFSVVWLSATSAVVVGDLASA